MERLELPKTYFSIQDTIECGQVFRYKKIDDKYMIISGGEIALLSDDVAICSSKEYFYNYFDFQRDYESIYLSAKEFNIPFLTTSADIGKGIRLLNQDLYECLLSFMVSQNNNIPRIQKIIENLCLNYGEKKKFLDIEYYSFPSAKNLEKVTIEEYKSLGLGYRAEYIYLFVKSINDGLNLEQVKMLDYESAKEFLLKIKGIGEKVANCVLLFGLKHTKSFPVDTWIEKVYAQNFDGKEKDRKKITKYFIDLFKENAGFYQQYMFHYKRNKE